MNICPNMMEYMTWDKTKNSPRKLTKIEFWIWDQANCWFVMKKLSLVVGGVLIVPVKIFIGGELAPTLCQENKSKTYQLCSGLQFFFFLMSIILIFVALYKILFSLNALKSFLFITSFQNFDYLCLRADFSFFRWGLFELLWFMVFVTFRKTWALFLANTFSSLPFSPLITGLLLHTLLSFIFPHSSLKLFFLYCFVFSVFSFILYFV